MPAFKPTCVFFFLDTSPRLLSNHFFDKHNPAITCATPTHYALQVALKYRITPNYTGHEPDITGIIVFDGGVTIGDDR